VRARPVRRYDAPYDFSPDHAVRSKPSDFGVVVSDRLQQRFGVFAVARTLPTVPFRQVRATDGKPDPRSTAFGALDVSSGLDLWVFERFRGGIDARDRGIDVRKQVDPRFAGPFGENRFEFRTEGLPDRRILGHVFVDQFWPTDGRTERLEELGLERPQRNVVSGFRFVDPLARISAGKRRFPGPRVSATEYVGGEGLRKGDDRVGHGDVQILAVPVAELT